MGTIKGAELIAEVRRIAAEMPGHTYTPEEGEGSCMYGHHDGPGCIIGWALQRLDPKVYAAVLEGWNGAEVDQLISGGLIDATEEEGVWLTAVQSRQDMEDRWGWAVAQASRTEGVGNV